MALISAVLILALWPSVSEGAETIILGVTLNGVPKGDFFIMSAGEGDFLVRTEDMLEMGFKESSGEVMVMGGEEYISLKSMYGVEFKFSADDLTLDITARPELLPTTTVDLQPPRRMNVRRTGGETSAFFNYRLDYVAGDSFAFDSFSLADEAGFRVRDLLFTTDSSYSRTEVGDEFVRLETSMTYDMRDTLQRFVAGDFFASPGDLRSSLNMGGLSFSKLYRIDPYFIKQPLFGLSGLVSMPSEVEVYLNGALIKRMKIQPGEFELQNIASYGGAGDLEILIKDPFGNVERISSELYYTDSVLKKGLHEYSYNAGFLREAFGVESFGYGGAAFSAFHRYGVSDSFTLGVASEAAGWIFNIGPEVSYAAVKAGLLSASLSASSDTSGLGVAGSLAHTYQSPYFSTRLLLRGYDEGYASINSGLTGERPRYEAGAGVSVGTESFGMVSLDYSASARYDDVDKLTASATYSLSPVERTTVFATYRDTREGAESEEEIYLGLSYYPWPSTTVSATRLSGGETETSTLQVQRNAPYGEGLGYRASLKSETSGGETAETFSPYLQYNSRYGIYTAEYKSYGDGDDLSEYYELTAAGGLAFVGGRVGVSRPVTDSFGLVRVEGLEGVGVSANNQAVGKTDRHGEVFVPDLNSYADNQVSISGRDIPIDYAVPEAIKVISPAYRSGTVIEFETARVQAVTGYLKIISDGVVRDAEFYDGSVEVDGSTVLFPTGKGGEFYLENIRPGAYRAAIVHDGDACSFDIAIPESGDVIIELGEIYCEAAP
jgi:outer membrane usher protein FimD/PapC